MSTKPRVFISCGQVTETEKALGVQIADLVNKLSGCEPYFAQDQSNLAGLFSNILGALDKSSGLITVMHPRGVVTGIGGIEHIRASVWIEQEIAIAAYMTEILRRKMEVAAFIHKDIQREGIRQLLQLNPNVFEKEAEIISKLREVLPAWRNLNTLANLVPRIQFSHTKKYPNIEYGYMHQFWFDLYLKNVGRSPISRFTIDLWFPAALMSTLVYGMEQPQKATKTHRCFRFSNVQYGIPTVYQGDEVKTFGTEFQIAENVLVFKKDQLETIPVKVRVFEENEPPQDYEFPLPDSEFI